ncbi:RHS repeat-associated core domain-containing protein [Rhodococcus sp. IEGM1300]
MPTQPSNTILLATDQQRSVLIALDKSRHQPIAYTPYGHRSSGGGLLSLLGFNGEPPDPLTGHYHLGNGYRQFNPVLMRFNSPDSWSPFGEGGLNAYAYCGGDPRNRVDPNGHTLVNLTANLWDTLFGNVILLKAKDPFFAKVQTTTAINNTIEMLGGTQNVNKIAIETNRHAYAITVSALPELGPIKSVRGYIPGENLYNYMSDRSGELTQLIEARNISSTVLDRQGEYFKHLNKSEIANLQRLTQHAQTAIDDRLDHFKTFFEPAQRSPTVSSAVTEIRRR